MAGDLIVAASIVGAILVLASIYDMWKNRGTPIQDAEKDLSRMSLRGWLNKHDR